MVLIAMAAFIVLAAFSVSKQTTPLTYDAQALALQFGNDAVDRLNSLYYEYSTRDLTDQQIKFMLSQNLFESGLFTDQANYRLMNQNNYAGLKTTLGTYAAYDTIADFTDAYLGFLSKRNNPLGASSLQDFVNRLVANCYFGCPPETEPNVYLNGLQTYYNLLS